MSLVVTWKRFVRSPTPPTIEPAVTSRRSRAIFACTAMYEPRSLRTRSTYSAGKCSSPTRPFTVLRMLDVETTTVAGSVVPSDSSTPRTRPDSTRMRRAPVPRRTSAPSSRASRTYVDGMAMEPPRGYESALSRAMRRKHQSASPALTCQYGKMK